MKIQSLFVVVTVLALSLTGCDATPDAASPSTPSTHADSGEDSSGHGDDASGDDTPATPPAEQDEAKDIVDTAVAAGSFTTLATALQHAELIDTLKSEGPFTVFAPTDEAFAKLPEGTVEGLLKPENKDQLVAILTYHVVPGKVDSSTVATLKSAKTVNGADVAVNVSDDGVKINDATVTTVDIECSNGIIHVIDSVILPPAPADSSAKPEHDGEPLSIEGVGTFSTLFTAIEVAELKETLANEGPFTIFAPTDAAFEALPEGALEDLLKPENRDKLVAILTYHVVAGEVTSGQVVELTSAKTVNGAEVTIQVQDGTVKVDEATVLKTDVPCEVGLIHAIDKVLMP